MTDDLTDAWDRLVPLRRLYQVAALLNMPRLGKTDAHEDTQQINQQATLYAGIADWARLSAQAAEQLGKPDAADATDLYAYLVEYTDQHAKGWHPAPSEHSQGIVLADTAEAVAQTVLTYYITHLAEHREDYELWLVDSLSLRASVWQVNIAAAHLCGRRPNCPSSAHTFKEAKISPHAIEILTPIQIHRFIDLLLSETRSHGNDDASD
ncbi:hypothetical protein AB0K16_44085 [Nonomuraea jabiensis]|uniref:hypothetical protein n=1 Tax=Nonomuraea jabiensis TaxID=882448 RepID=UPI0034318ECB